MKIVLILISFPFCLIHSQDSNWYNFEFDSTISVEMPANEVFEIDTIVQDYRLKNLYLTVDNSNFIVQRMTRNRDVNENLSNLPHDSISLNKYYLGVIDGMDDSVPYDISLKEIITKDGFHGYRVMFNDSLNIPVFDAHIFQLGKETYTFSYVNYSDFDKQSRDLFFNSIIINNPTLISQYQGKELGYRIGYLVGKYIVGGLLMIILIFVAIKFFKK